MKIIEQDNNQIKFSLDINDTLANAIRRYVNHVLILAIDEVEISKNDSPLYDETIAHRMGLIPIKMQKIVNEKTEEQISLVSKKEGFVYSGELNGNVKPVYDNIPITLLKKGQELEILATVRAGKGIKHAKFSPGTLTYRNSVKIKVDKECPKEVVKECPLNILKSENGKVVSVDEEKCDICESCTDFCERAGKKSIELIPTEEIVMELESFGQLDKKEIFKKSIETLKEDLKEFSKNISKK